MTGKPPVKKGSSKSIKKPSLLIVDDEEAMRKSYPRVLRSIFEKEDIKEASSGNIAIAMLKDGSNFDVIISDVMMKDGTGMDLRNWVRDNRSEFLDRMLFITGGAFTPETQQFLQKLDKNTKLDKPFNPAELRSRVRDILDSDNSEKKEDFAEGLDEDASDEELLRRALSRRTVRDGIRGSDEEPRKRVTRSMMELVGSDNVDSGPPKSAPLASIASFGDGGDSKVGDDHGRSGIFFGKRRDHRPILPPTEETMPLDGVTAAGTIIADTGAHEPVKDTRRLVVVDEDAAAALEELCSAKTPGADEVPQNGKFQDAETGEIRLADFVEDKEEE